MNPSEERADDKPEEKFTGRCLRSGLKPNFRPNFKPNSKPNRNKGNDKKGPKVRLKINKNVLKDPKLFVHQMVKLERLRGHVIRQYDKQFYKKHAKRLKAEKALNKYSKIRQSLVKSNSKPKITESPKRMLLWTTPKQQHKQQTNYPILRSQARRAVKYDDRENSLISLPEFCRNLNLISFKDRCHMSDKQMNTSFGLRHISKAEDYTLNQNNEIEINYEYLIGTSNEDLTTNTNSNQLNAKNKKNKKRNVWTVNKVKQKYSKLELQKRRMAELWKKNYLNCLSMYDISSPMGRRVFTSLKTQRLETRKVESLVKRYDSYCGTRFQSRHRSKETVQWNNWKARRIERLTTGLELSVKNRCFDCHQYSFTRRQRLEKKLRTKTGIDWKSRLLALNCSTKSEVSITKMKVCPLCGQDIEINHNCDNIASDCESTPLPIDDFKQNSANISINTRILRNQNRISGEMTDKVSPQISTMKKKRKRSLSPRKPRVCSIDLDKSDA